jgi:hypothetical protein
MSYQLKEKIEMVTIGGKKKALKPTQPQFVVQLSQSVNEFMLMKEGEITWIGDPNAATKFESKYAAKVRIRELADVPDTRCFREI